MVVMGLYPKFIIDRVEPSMAPLLQRVQSAQARLDQENHAINFAKTDKTSPAVIRRAAKDLRQAISPAPAPLTSSSKHIMLMSSADQ
jgi:hypothetical protein